MKLSERPSSARWSTAASASLPSAHHTPLSRPQSRSVEISSRCSPRSGSSSSTPSPSQSVRSLDLRRGPSALGHPAAGPLHVARGRRHGLLHPHAQGRLLRDPRVLALQPLVPPAQALLEEADRGTGLDLVRERVRPRPDQPLRGCLQSGQEPQHRLGVAVRPAADGVNGAPDRAEVLAHRALFPVLVAALVAKPLVLVGLDAVDPLEPGVAPPVPGHLRVGGDRVEGQHRRSPREHLEREHRAPAVVHVIGVAVVCRAERDHRLELRRRVRRHLEPVEPAPGDPEHPHRPGAPGLLGDPAEHLERVLLLQRQVLVVEQAVGLPGAAQVHPQRGVPVPREVHVARPVARRRAVALAVGDVLEDRRDRVALGVLGKPDAGAEPGAVRHRDPHVVDRAHGAREVAHHAHQRIGAPSSSSACSPSPGAGRPLAPARPSTLKTLPSRRTGAHTGLLDRLH